MTGARVSSSRIWIWSSVAFVALTLSVSACKGDVSAEGGSPPNSVDTRDSSNTDGIQLPPIEETEDELPSEPIAGEVSMEVTGRDGWTALVTVSFTRWSSIPSEAILEACPYLELTVDSYVNSTVTRSQVVVSVDYANASGGLVPPDDFAPVVTIEGANPDQWLPGELFVCSPTGNRETGFAFHVPTAGEGGGDAIFSYAAFIERTPADPEGVTQLNRASQALAESPTKIDSFGGTCVVLEASDGINAEELFGDVCRVYPPIS